MCLVGGDASLVGVSSHCSVLRDGRPSTPTSMAGWAGSPLPPPGASLRDWNEIAISLGQNRRAELGMEAYIPPH